VAGPHPLPCPPIPLLILTHLSLLGACRTPTPHPITMAAVQTTILYNTVPINIGVLCFVLVPDGVGYGWDGVGVMGRLTDVLAGVGFDGN
jgi:hypothetical protein